jgi:hypothetical protein
LTDEQRRSSDPRIDNIEQALVRLTAKVDDIDMAQAFRDHVARHHDGGNLDTSVERIIDALEGAPIFDLHGDEVGREPGIIEKVDEALVGQREILDNVHIVEQRTNGGVHVTQKVERRPFREWSRTEKIATVSVAAFVFFASLPGIVAVIEWLAEQIVNAGL